MANRYWVGGTGNWDNTNTANWSTSSGGGGGASVPTSVDSVFFDANSNVGTGAFTVTLNVTDIFCLDFTVSGLDGAMTFAMGVNILNVHGSWSTPATNFTLTTGSTASLDFELAASTTSTFTTNGYTLPAGLIIRATGSSTGTLRLGSALTGGRNVQLDFGTLDLNGFTITTPFFQSNVSNTRAIAFGSSNIVLSSTGAGATILAMGGLLNFSYTGTGGFVRNQGTTATATVGTSGATTANAPNLSITGGSAALTITTNSWFKNLDFTGSTCTVTGASGAVTNINMAGALTFATGGTYTAVIPIFQTSQTLDTLAAPNNKTIAGLGISGGATVTLARNTTTVNNGTTTLTSGTLNLNDFTLTTAIFSSNNSNTRSIAFGTTGSIVLISAGAGTTVLSMATATGFTFTGTSNISAAMSVARTFSFGGTAGATASNRLNINLTSGASAPTFTGSFRQINFTGTTSTYGGTANCHGFTLASGGTYTAATFVIVGTGTLTANGKAFTALTINAAGATATLQDNLVVENPVTTSVGTTITAGTLDLNNFSLTTNILSSDNSNTRAIAFGTTGSIVLTSFSATNPVLAMATATNFTFTGTSNIRAQLNSADKTFRFGNSGGATASNRLNIGFIDVGSPSTQFTFTGSFRQIDFTGSTATVGAVTINCHGFTLASGGTYSATTFNIIGDGTLTFTGRSISQVIIDGSGITSTLASAGQTFFLTLVNGTLDLNGYTLTSTSTAATSAGTKNLTFNGGTLVCSAASATAWNNINPTGFTTTAGTGTGTISMTAATAKTFVGGGSTYNCTLNQGGAGTLTITGANTFNNITNTNATASQITFPASTTTTVNAFTLSGSSGNLVSLRSSTPGTQFTLSDSSGTVSVSYLNIQDSNATGGATWEAFTVNGNVDNGNNLGWLFAPPVLSGGNFFLLLS